jgi:hypothetical protein
MLECLSARTSAAGHVCEEDCVMNYGFGNVTKRATGTHYLSKVSVNADDMASRPEHLFKVSVVAVCSWILIEAPLELIGSIDSTSLLAVVTSKVLICLIGVGAIVDLRLTRHVFAFICARLDGRMPR